MHSPPAGAVARVRTLVRDPFGTAVRRRARQAPGALLERHARLARRAGLDRVQLVLSFDCDTDEDARVVADVHRRLGELGVVPTYAVPGSQLTRARETYGALASSGAEFVNHGGTEHTYFDHELGRYASCFFYDTLDAETIRRDVEEGHALVAEVAGRAPEGFRTPHFGTYARPRQLRYLHGILRDLGYRFSTSTTPRLGFRDGPVSRRYDLPELPVTGSPDAPFEILDTWAFFAAPDRARTPAEYLSQARTLATGLARAGAGLINVYGDPVHVHDRPEFFAAVEAWAEVAEPISYGALLDRLGL
jgi:hypothetical protein